MTLKDLEKALNDAFDAHASAIRSGDREKVMSAWNDYARAKNIYLEAYYSGVN